MDGRAQLIHEAMKGAEKSIPEMADILGVSEGHAFDVAISVGKELEDIGLRCHPPITKGEYDEKRVVTPNNEINEHKVLEEIQEDEAYKLEFKSTLLYDIKQAEAREDCDPRNINSEKVVTSALKTICGFLNAQGGVLYIGVSDDKAIYGLEKDLSVLGGSASYDQWELKLRDYINSRFLDPKEIQYYVKIDRISVQGMVVARVEVSRRSKETFLKIGGQPTFFIRTGNRTDKINIENLPDVVRKRDSDALL